MGVIVYGCTRFELHFLHSFLFRAGMATKSDAADASAVDGTQFGCLKRLFAKEQLSSTDEDIRATENAINAGARVV